MNKFWFKIWNKEERIIKYTFEFLLKLDGFDTKTSTFDPDFWLNRFSKFMDIIEGKMGKINSVYEVGCGAGAFLFYLKYFKHIEKVGGLDFSSKLLQIARCFLDTDLEVKEAINLDVKPTYDLVLSHSVFFYFPNIEYAEKVLIKMLQKANKGVAILDINDNERKNLYFKYRKNYDSPHIFFERKWFIELGKQLNKKVYIFDLPDSKYLNSLYRFNVIFY